MNKLPIFGIFLFLTIVTCPTDFCSEEQTLCWSLDHKPKCCHMSDGICCLNGRFCCHQGYTCNNTTSRCDKADSEALSFLEQESPAEELQEIIEIQKPEIKFENILTCISDIKLVVKDLNVVISDYIKGDVDSLNNIKYALLQLAMDGYKLSHDCNILLYTLQYKS